MRGTWSPSKPAPFRYMFYGCPVMARSLLVGDLPVYMFVTMKHHFVIFGSLYLVFRAECAHVSPTPIRTHLHTPESSLPHCVRPHIYIYLGNFPGHRSTPVFSFRIHPSVRFVSHHKSVTQMLCYFYVGFDIPSFRSHGDFCIHLGTFLLVHRGPTCCQWM